MDIDDIIEGVGDERKYLKSTKFEYVDNIPVKVGEVNIDCNMIEEGNHVATFLSDYEIIFKLINTKNKFELQEDSDVQFKNRLAIIRPIKKAFIRFINNFKRNKDNINNITTILHYYTLMRYYYQVFKDVVVGGATRVGERYEVMTSTGDRRPGEVFTESSSTTISNTNSVKPLFPIIVEKKYSKYIIKSYIDVSEFDIVLRSVIVPIGWDVEYRKIEDVEGEFKFDLESTTLNILRFGNAYYFDNMEIFAETILSTALTNSKNNEMAQEYSI